MPAPFVENAVFFPLDGFSSLVKYQVTICVWVHLWVFNSVTLVYLSVAIPVPCSFYHNCSVVQLLVRHGNSTRELLKLINNFSKVAGYKINSNKSMAFPYTKDKWAEKEIRETTPFSIVTNNI